MLISASGPVVDRVDGDRDDAGVALEAVPHGVLDQRLHDKNAPRSAVPRGDVQRERPAIGEAGLLEHQIPLGVAQLLGEGRVLAPMAQARSG